MSGGMKNYYGVAVFRQNGWSGGATEWMGGGSYRVAGVVAKNCLGWMRGSVRGKALPPSERALAGLAGDGG